MFFSGSSGEKHFDRGDLAAADFVKTDLTADGAFHELDLSGIIPPHTKRVIIYVIGATTAVNSNILFRTKGCDSWFNIARIYFNHAGWGEAQRIELSVSEDLMIEYLIPNGVALNTMDISVCCWTV